MRTIISTVGTSLLSNARRHNRTPEEWLAEATPEELSAESNALKHLDVSPDRDRLVFLCSATDDGKRAAELLCERYSTRFIVESTAIAGLHLNTGQFGDHGLTNLVRELCRLVRSYGPDVVINATGGFKAEVAYSTLVGTLFKVPVAYIYEQFNRVVLLPAMPIHFDLHLYTDHEDAIDAVLNAPDRKTASKLFQKLPAQLRVLLEKSENTSNGNRHPYVLSPVGEAIREYATSNCEELSSERATNTVIEVGKSGSHSTLPGDGITSSDQLDPELRRVIEALSKELGVNTLRFTRYTRKNMGPRALCRVLGVHEKGIIIKVTVPSGCQRVILPCPKEEREKYLEKVGQWAESFNSEAKQT